MPRPTLSVQIENSPPSEDKEDNLDNLTTEANYINALANNDINMINEITHELQHIREQVIQNDVINILNRPISIHRRFVNLFNYAAPFFAHTYKTNINNINSDILLQKTPSNKDVIIKIMQYQEFDIMFDIMFLFEAIMQQHAFYANESCNIKVPEIYNYGIFENSTLTNSNTEFGTRFFYIIMEYLPYEPLALYLKNVNLTNKTTCNNLANKLNNAYKCLVDQTNIHHNDYHKENIMMKNNILGIIDYGKASYGISNLDEGVFTNEYDCNDLRKFKTKYMTENIVKTPPKNISMRTPKTPSKKTMARRVRRYNTLKLPKINLGGTKRKLRHNIYRNVRI